MHLASASLIPAADFLKNSCDLHLARAYTPPPSLCLALPHVRSGDWRVGYSHADFAWSRLSHTQDNSPPFAHRASNWITDGRGMGGKRVDGASESNSLVVGNPPVTGFYTSKHREELDLRYIIHGGHRENLCE